MSTLSRLLLLDTNIIIHLVRGDTVGQAVDSPFGLRVRAERPLVSAVTLGEALAFAQWRSWGTERIARLRDLLRELPLVSISTQPVLDRYVGIDTFLKRTGRSLSDNAVDAPRGRVFGLIHEFTHLMLSQGGVCGPRRVGRHARTQYERSEAFCDRVAGAILIPHNTRFGDSLVAPVGCARERSDELAWARERKGVAAVFRNAVRHNGHQYTRLVLEALDRGRITLADVSDYLGVRLKHLGEITGAARNPGL